jgi:hypothetical protein
MMIAEWNRDDFGPMILRWRRVGCEIGVYGENNANIVAGFAVGYLAGKYGRLKVAWVLAIL